MLIREMNKEECLQVLAETRLARLACAHENQPYVVPVYLAFHQTPKEDACLYGFTTQGQKVEWMRSNPLVCIQMDEITNSNKWKSVVVMGRYEELPVPSAENVGRAPARQGLDEHEDLPMAQALFAHHLLEARGLWWEPAITARAASAHRHAADPPIPIYYKIQIDRVTGHEASSAAVD